jgi:hypothetical protein
MYRVRQRQYRVIYLDDDAARSVDVLKVGHRREVDRRGSDGVEVAAFVADDVGREVGGGLLAADGGVVAEAER